MRQTIFTLIALTAISIIASCSRVDQPTLNGEANVSFCLSTNEVATRAYGDGTSATKLFYGVYKVGAQDELTLVNDLSNTTNGVEIDGTANVNLRLINGSKYAIVFFAKSPNGVCTVDWYNLEMTYNPTDANMEDYDAFYAFVQPFVVTGNLEQSIPLKRPFAQLNIGTSDEKVVDDASVTISSYNDVLDLKTGIADKRGTNPTLTYQKNAPSQNEVFPKGPNYKYVAMNYILVGDDPMMVDVTLSINDNTISKVYQNICLKRNYRTNIYGELFTENADFEVNIEENFNNPDFENSVNVVADANEANQAFEEGKTSVKIETITAETELVLPETTETTSIILPNTDNQVTISYPENAAVKPETLSIDIPLGSADAIILNVPNTTVYINGVLQTVTASTAQNTLYVGNGTEITTLIIAKGNVVIEEGGQVTGVQRTDDNEDQQTIVTVKDGAVAPTTIGENVVLKYETLTVGTEEELLDAITNNTEIKLVLTSDIEMATNTVITIGSGKSVSINLNGKTLSSTNGKIETFRQFINVNGGILSVSNGTVTYTHTAENMGWDGGTGVFNVTAGGVLNLKKVVAQNTGGTDMNFCVHLNNWGEVTLNAENCVFNSTYCGVRVFNSGYDDNIVNIKNSKLTGGNRAFWVHNYIGDLNKAQHSDDAVKERLKLNIYNNGNKFEIKNTAKSPIRYGFNTTVYFDESGNVVE